ncbi:hypothetical protein K9R62_05075 (plasmid) [Borrelia hermsii]|uniref:Variable large protein n=1 Tax=Borrelia hermsii TaxID=140 RepID=T1ECF7_BORHE|nr:hypothetical protein BHA143 [Borrelia hermsii]UCP02012.1 hypothetical protein K9R62_05075 [Borrelia hermsii]
MKYRKVYKTILSSFILLRFPCGALVKNGYHGESEFKNIIKAKAGPIAKEKITSYLKNNLL